MSLGPLARGHPRLSRRGADARAPAARRGRDVDTDGRARQRRRARAAGGPRHRSRTSLRPTGAPTWLDDSLPDACAASFEQRLRPLARASTGPRSSHADAPEQDHRATHSRTAPDQQRGHASSASEAEAQLELLLTATGAGASIQSDFYSYRYFASEGFLPGYSFPRLPLSAFIPGRRRAPGQRRVPVAPALPGDQRVRPAELHLPRGLALHDQPGHPARRDAPTRDRTDSSLTARRRLRRSAATSTRVDERRRSRPVPALRQPPRAGTRSSLFRLQNVDHEAPRPDQLRRGGAPAPGLRDPERRPLRRVRRTVARQTATVERRRRARWPRLATATPRPSGGSTRLERRRKPTAPLGFVLDIERGYWAKDDSGHRRRRARRPAWARGPSASCPTSRTAATACSSSRPALGDRGDGLARGGAQERDPGGVPARGPELAAEPLPDGRRPPRTSSSTRRPRAGRASCGGSSSEPDALRRGRAARRSSSATSIPTPARTAASAPGAKEACEAACYDCLMSYAQPARPPPARPQADPRPAPAGSRRRRRRASLRRDLTRDEHFERLKRAARRRASSGSGSTSSMDARLPCCRPTASVLFEAAAPGPTSSTTRRPGRRLHRRPRPRLPERRPSGTPRRPRALEDARLPRHRASAPTRRLGRDRREVPERLREREAGT